MVAETFESMVCMSVVFDRVLPLLSGALMAALVVFVELVGLGGAERGVVVTSQDSGFESRVVKNRRTRLR